MEVPTPSAGDAAGCDAGGASDSDVDEGSALSAAGVRRWGVELACASAGADAGGGTTAMESRGLAWLGSNDGAATFSPDSE